uniref:Prolyl 4-hydroxylase alpha subunit domain-containing protein n=1 Tax=Sinocyclocheilus grahami TaxID=75366 RepID=A0A672SAV8_SINGR
GVHVLRLSPFAGGTSAAFDSMAEHQGNQAAADQTSEDQTITDDPHRCPDQTSGRMELPKELRKPRSNRAKSKEHKRLNTHKLVLQYIVPCMNSYGLCIVDNFLGDRIGERVVQEVKRIHQSGSMQDGQLVGHKLNKSKAIRGDKIAWVDGTESGCQNIGYLLTRMDKLITCADGKLDKFKIRGRHKAMVACYPGNGAGYVKHVDNPNADGRCVTCIYYLNKNWNAKPCMYTHTHTHTHTLAHAHTSSCSLSSYMLTLRYDGKLAYALLLWERDHDKDWCAEM